jgi:hypothetical protein
LIGKQVYSQNNKTVLFTRAIGIEPGGFPLSLMNGYGNSNLLNDISNLGSMNPAALENFNKNVIGISYQFWSKFESSLSTNIFYQRINQIIPLSIGFAYPLGNLKIGLSMHQKYNESVSLGPGEYFTSEIKTTDFNYSLTASYTFPQFLNNSFITVGFRYGLNNLKYNETYNSASLYGSIYASDFSAGIVYKLRKEENNYLQFGLTYESELSLSKISVWHGGNVFADTEDGRFIEAEDQPIKLNAKFPSTLRFDIDISTISKMKILASFSDVYWSLISDYIRNQTELSVSCVYLLNETFSPSIGFIYINRIYAFELLGPTEIYQNDSFITAGIVIKYRNMNIHFALADGHLTNPWRKQTVFNTNISYNF